MKFGFFDGLKTIQSGLAQYQHVLLTGQDIYQKQVLKTKLYPYFPTSTYEHTRISIHQSGDEVQLYQINENLSLFQTQRFINIVFEKNPDKNMQQALINVLTTPNQNDFYMIDFTQLTHAQQKAKWFSSLSKQSHILHCQVWPPTWQMTLKLIQFEAQQKGLTCQQNALVLLAQKTEGNLFAAQQVLFLLQQQNIQQVTIDQLQPFLQNHMHFTVFDLTDALLTQTPEKVLRIFHQLVIDKTEPILLLWGINKVIRLLYQLNKCEHVSEQNKLFTQYYIWKNKQEAYLKKASSLTEQQLVTFFTACHQVDQKIKTNQATQSEITTLIRQIIMGLLDENLESITF